jgi:hypothetical protein
MTLRPCDVVEPDGDMLSASADPMSECLTYLSDVKVCLRWAF